MKSNQDTGDAWFQERFGRTAAARSWSKQRVFWYGGSLLTALALLISFYIVLNQSVSRAQQRWAEAGGNPRTASTDVCGASRARESCASGNLESSRLRSTPSGLIATGR